ncbi:MAG: restriction endonuclease subunit S [Candidatus Competibacteraceae bacterium]|nr:restriction endonuclease subunit S [Candidatus Competibacteraceae bacterium]
MSKIISKSISITSEWGTVRLGDVVETSAGGTPSRGSRGMFGGSIPWVKSSELNQRRIVVTEETLTNEGFTSSAAKWVEAGTPLIALYGATAGVVGWLELRACTNQAVLALTPRNKSVTHRWIYWIASYCASRLIASVQGSGQPNLNKGIVDELTLHLPSPTEQSRIAAVLDTVDEAIAKTEAVIAKLKQVRAGLLHDLLTRGLDENGQLRDPIAHPEQFQDSPIGRIPNAWRIAQLCEVADIASGVTLGKNPTGAGTLELPYLRVANVQDGYLDLADVKTVRIFSSELDRFQLKYGDVLMNEGGDYDKLGRGTVWESQIPVCLHQNHVFRVRCRSDILNCYFLTAVSGSEVGKRYFLRSSKQSTNLASINSTQLNAFEVPVPHLAEQETIIKVLSAQDNQLTVEAAGLTKLRAIKSALMTDLLTGRVRVPADLDFG